MIISCSLTSVLCCDWSFCCCHTFNWCSLQKLCCVQSIPCIMFHDQTEMIKSGLCDYIICYFKTVLGKCNTTGKQLLVNLQPCTADHLSCKCEEPPCSISAVTVWVAGDHRDYTVWCLFMRLALKIICYGELHEDVNYLFEQRLWVLYHQWCVYIDDQQIAVTDSCTWWWCDHSYPMRAMIMLYISNDGIVLNTTVCQPQGSRMPVTTI